MVGYCYYQDTQREPCPIEAKGEGLAVQVSFSTFGMLDISDHASTHLIAAFTSFSNDGADLMYLNQLPGAALR
jgi:hypothetical protein